MLLDQQAQVHHKTLVVSEDPKILPEVTDPTKSPRPLKNKLRTGNAGKGVVTAGNLSTPHLDDVISFFLLFASFLVNNDHLIILLLSCASRLFVAYNKGDARHGYSLYRVR
jgi:hypothetical protein